MSIDTVVTTIDRLGVATVTLNNPGRHNAFDDKTIAELQLAFEAVASNSGYTRDATELPKVLAFQQERILAG